MNTVLKILIGFCVLWSSVYSASFAASEFKTQNTAGGITALIAVIVMVITYIKGIGL